jgi:hypothetical protein
MLFAELTSKSEKIYFVRYLLAMSLSKLPSGCFPIEAKDSPGLNT